MPLNFLSNKKLGRINDLTTLEQWLFHFRELNISLLVCTVVELKEWPLICETFITLNTNVKRNVNRQFMVIQAQLDYSCVCNLHIFRCSMKSLLWNSCFRVHRLIYAVMSQLCNINRLYIWCADGLVMWRTSTHRSRVETRLNMIYSVEQTWISEITECKQRH